MAVQFKKPDLVEGIGQMINLTGLGYTKIRLVLYMKAVLRMKRKMKGIYIDFKKFMAQEKRKEEKSATKFKKRKEKKR